MPAECLRTVLSCARCRRRKIKCDRAVPTCLKCKAAGVACTGFNPKGDTEIPRSVVHFLEHEIASLETRIGKDVPVDANNGSPIPLESVDHVGNSICSPGNISSALQASFPQDAMKKSLMESKELQSMISATMPLGTGLTDLLSSVRMGLTPSYTPPSAPAGGESTQTQSAITTRQFDDVADLSVLISLPSHVIYSLVKKYVQRVLPVFPFLYEQTVWEHVNRILRKHLSNKAPFSNDLAEIQSTLLLLQYALINPKSANVWILSGVVMRSCLELGLHREVSGAAGLDSLTIDLRRQIFWVAYCMDGSICSALQCPLSIPDPTIDILFPASAHNDLESGMELRPDPAKMLALRQIQFAKIQSTIIEVHFQGKPLDNGQEWDDWLAATYQSLRDWYEVSPAEEDRSWTELAFSTGLTNLYRPSPRIPFPSHKSLLSAFEAACGSARIYQQHIASGFYRRPWLAAHHTFSSAMVALFCLRYGFEKICQRWNAGELFQMTNLFTMNLLSLSSQGWPEISKYAGTYERLLGPLLDSVFSQSSSPSKTFGPAQDAEMARLIYPGPAHVDKLRFGNARAALDPNFLEFDAALFDWDDVLLGGSGTAGWGEGGQVNEIGSQMVLFDQGRTFPMPASGDPVFAL